MLGATLHSGREIVLQAEGGTMFFFFVIRRLDRRIHVGRRDGPLAKAAQ